MGRNGGIVERDSGMPFEMVEWWWRDGGMSEIVEYWWIDSGMSLEMVEW